MSPLRLWRRRRMIVIVFALLCCAFSFVGHYLLDLDTGRFSWFVIGVLAGVSLAQWVEAPMWSSKLAMLKALVVKLTAHSCEREDCTERKN